MEAMIKFPPLRPTQQEDVRDIVGRTVTIINNPLGSGKTRVTMCALAGWMSLGVIDAVIILGKKSILNSVWIRQMKEAFPDGPFFPVVLSGDTMPAKRLAMWQDPKYNVFIAVHQLITNSKDSGWMAGLMRSRKVALVVDEAHALANVDNKFSKYVAAARQMSHRVLFLTATPLENGPMDLYGLHTAAGWQMGTPNEFIRKWCTYESVRINGVGPRGFIEKIVAKEFRPQVERSLKALLKSSTIRRKPDPLDVDYVVMDREVTLAPDEATLYKEYSGDYKALAKKIHAGFAGMTEANDYLKAHPELRAILSGKRGKNPAKDAELIGLVPELVANGRFIVYSPFSSTIYRLEEKLKAMRLNPVTITGDVTTVNRDKAISRFESDVECKCMLITDAAAEGLNLQYAASQIVFFDRSYNPGKEDQVEGRIRRPGQAKAVLRINFIVPDTIDEDIIEILGRKRGQMDLVERLSAK